MEELKPCPFCGGKARIENTSIEEVRTEKADFSACWKVWCPKCGTAKQGGQTYYKLTNKQELDIVGIFDGRKKAIENWNARAVTE